MPEIREKKIIYGHKALGLHDSSVKNNRKLKHDEEQHKNMVSRFQDQTTSSKIPLVEAMEHEGAEHQDKLSPELSRISILTSRFNR